MVRSKGARDQNAAQHDLGRRIKAIRTARGVTLATAAEEMGLSSSGHLSFLERGLCNLTMRTHELVTAWLEKHEGDALTGGGSGK